MFSRWHKEPQPPTQAFLGELVFHPSKQTAVVGGDEKRAPLKTPAWEAKGTQALICKLQMEIK